MNSITQDFENHANRIAAGFRAMSPAPDRHFNPHQTMTETTAPDPTENTEPTETSDSIVIRESGLVGSFELRWQAQADIEGLTADLLSKKERSELLNLSEACDRLAAEIAKADSVPRNPSKVAAAWNAAHPGTPVPQDLVERAANGEELRRFAKSTAKVAAGLFFDEQAVPAIRNVFSKAADKLRDVIAQRVKDEQAAFERFREIYNDGDSVPYKPSQGLLRLMSRRRQLLDNEILRTSPPSIASSLQGVYKLTAA